MANFNLEKLLGEGSSGQVCAATQISDGKQVAVKRVVGAFYSRRDALCIIREVRILAALPRHDNIVNLLDVRTPQENPSDDADVFLIFEKAATDLEKVVASNQYFTGSEEEKKAALDDYWRHIEEEAYYEKNYNQFMGAPPRAAATASASAYWSEEAQILYARDMAARIIQNNWKKIYLIN